jgi:hypothetical protein
MLSRLLALLLVVPRTAFDLLVHLLVQLPTPMTERTGRVKKV